MKRRSDDESKEHDASKEHDDTTDGPVKKPKRIASLASNLQQELDACVAKIDEWAEIESRVQATLALVPNVVKLDVGGTIFKMTKDTLLRVEGSYFHALLGSGRWTADANEAFFLDLDSMLFHHVALFLRTGELSTVGLNVVQRKELASMMEYLKLTDAAGVGDVLMRRSRWNPEQCPGHLTISNNMRTVECRNVDMADACVSSTHPAQEFRVRIDEIDWRQVGFVGLAPSPLKNFTLASGYLVRSCGRLYYRGEETTAPSIGIWRTGDIVTVRCDGKTIEFARNWDPPVSIPLAESTISDAMYPVLVACDIGMKVSFLD